jgi:hypothetical protein
MRLTDVFLSLDREGFTQLLRGVSMGKLKTYQLYARIKTRTHLEKLNSETLVKAAPRLWKRLGEHDEEFARDLSQAVLVSHLDMIVAVLNFLGIPHEDGFFVKDLDAKPYLNDGWEDRVLAQFCETYPEPVLRFYTGHLAWELHADNKAA